MESILNCFISPVSRDLVGRDLSDDLIIVTEFVDHVEVGPSGDSTDFVIKKKPVKVDEYHLNKEIAERAKGNDLKSIVARCEKTGDLSELNSRKVVFGDGVLTPRTLGDAFEKAEEGASYMDGLSKEEMQHIYDLSKMSKSELDAYIKQRVDEQIAAQNVEKVGEKDGE